MNNFYNITGVERLVLINQYELRKKGERNKILKNHYESLIKYLEAGQIYLFEKELANQVSNTITNQVVLKPIIDEKMSELLIDILVLHDILQVNCMQQKIPCEKLRLDFTNDFSSIRFINNAINSKLFPAFNNFKVTDSHGSKNLASHKKQIAWWYRNNNKTVLSTIELNEILDFNNL